MNIHTMRQRTPPPRTASVVARATAILLPMLIGSKAMAIEPTAVVTEYYNASLNHYFVTAFPDEAAMLDRGDAVKGWVRTGVSWNAWKNATDSATAVPVCRFFGTPNVGPNSHFYTASAAECAQVKQNPNWTFEGIAFYIDVPGTLAGNASCKSGTEPIYRSFYPGAKVSESNHRFLPDLTLHQKMASSSQLEGVVMCSPLSSAQAQADIVRFLEQATFGPNDNLIAHVNGVGISGFLNEQFASPASQYSSNKYVPAGAANKYCPTDPNPNCARDYYSLFMLSSVPTFFRGGRLESARWTALN